MAQQCQLNVTLERESGTKEKGLFFFSFYKLFLFILSQQNFVDIIASFSNGFSVRSHLDDNVVTVFFGEKWGKKGLFREIQEIRAF